MTLPTASGHAVSQTTEYCPRIENEKAKPLRTIATAINQRERTTHYRIRGTARLSQLFWLENNASFPVNRGNRNPTIVLELDQCPTIFNLNKDNKDSACFARPFGQSV